MTYTLAAQHVKEYPAPMIDTQSLHLLLGILAKGVAVFERDRHGAYAQGLMDFDELFSDVLSAHKDVVAELDLRMAVKDVA